MLSKNGLLISAFKRLIASKISFCLHNVYIFCVYKYKHMHVYLRKMLRLDIKYECKHFLNAYRVCVCVCISGGQ